MSVSYSAWKPNVSGNLMTLGGKVFQEQHQILPETSVSICTSVSTGNSAVKKYVPEELCQHLSRSAVWNVHWCQCIGETWADNVSSRQALVSLRHPINHMAWNRALGEKFFTVTLCPVPYAFHIFLQYFSLQEATRSINDQEIIMFSTQGQVSSVSLPPEIATPLMDVCETVS